RVQVYPIGIGLQGLETPVMDTRIGQKIPNPTWTPTAGIRQRSEGVIHWVSTAHALPIEIRLYDRLFSVPNPGAAEDFLSVINPES
ncbi:hypothetical protein MJL48_29615, partial [Salmonella enterica subsp. enterica serovar Kentucky]|nr:hypothetical protein [Salmonella enterica subsp. enterica serovar Kentucky]